MRGAVHPLGLTRRQCEVMDALCRLGCAKAVGAELGVNPKTVDMLVRAAMVRMKSKTRLLAALEWDSAGRKAA